MGNRLREVQPAGAAEASMAGGCVLGLSGMKGSVSGTDQQAEALFDGVGWWGLFMPSWGHCVCACMREGAANLGVGVLI